jgi:hypothetical protein
MYHLHQSPVNNYHPDIIHYIIYTNMTNTSHVTSDITNYTLSGVSTGSTYFISVSAVNVIGEGPNSTILYVMISTSEYIIITNITTIFYIKAFITTSDDIITLVMFYIATCINMYTGTYLGSITSVSHEHSTNIL